MTENIIALKERRKELVDSYHRIELKIMELKAKVEAAKVRGNKDPRWFGVQSRHRLLLNTERTEIGAELSRVNAHITNYNITVNNGDIARSHSKGMRKVQAEMRRYRIFFECARSMLAKETFGKIHAEAVNRSVGEVRE